MRMKTVHWKRSTGNVKRQAVQQCIRCALQVLLKGLFEGLPWPCASAHENVLCGNGILHATLPKDNCRNCNLLILTAQTVTTHHSFLNTLWLYLAQWERSYPDQLHHNSVLKCTQPSLCWSWGLRFGAQDVTDSSFRVCFYLLRVACQPLPYSCAGLRNCRAGGEVAELQYMYMLACTRNQIPSQYSEKWTCQHTLSHPNTWEMEAGALQLIQGLPQLHSKLYACLECQRDPASKQKRNPKTYSPSYSLTIFDCCNIVRASF